MYWGYFLSPNLEEVTGAFQFWENHPLKVRSSTKDSCYLSILQEVTVNPETAIHPVVKYNLI